MKTKLPALWLLLASCLLVPVTKASLILYDPFDYSPGDLGQANTSNVWSRTGSGDTIQIVSSSLVYPGYAASSGGQVQWGGDGRISRTDFTAVTSGSIFASFLYRMDNIGDLTTTGGALAGLVNAANTANPNSRVYIRKDASNPAMFNFGVLEKNSAIAWSSAQMGLNTTYLVVLSLDFIDGPDNDTARLWVNPSASTFGASSAPAATLTASGGPDSTRVDRFRLIQNPTGGSATLQTVDELRIGTTWADVVVASSVPEPTVLGLGILGSAWMMLRRRRIRES